MTTLILIAMIVFWGAAGALLYRAFQQDKKRKEVFARFAREHDATWLPDGLETEAPEWASHPFFKRANRMPSEFLAGKWHGISFEMGSISTRSSNKARASTVLAFAAPGKRFPVLFTIPSSLPSVLLGLSQKAAEKMGVALSAWDSFEMKRLVFHPPGTFPIEELTRRRTDSFREPPMLAIGLMPGWVLVSLYSTGGSSESSKRVEIEAEILELLERGRRVYDEVNRWDS